MTALIDAIAGNAVRMATAPALSSDGSTLTYERLAATVAERADRFRASGGTVLALAADNSPDWVLTDLAARAAGLAVVPVPHFFAPSQKLHLLADSGADLVIAAEADVRSLALDVTPAGEPVPGCAGLPAWRRRVAAGTVKLPRGTVKISYTSGTTGRPKGVCIGETAAADVAESLVDATAVLELRRHLCLLPFATLLENIAGVEAPLRAGAEVVVPGLEKIGWSGTATLDARKLCRVISRREPDSIILVPEMLRALLAAIALGWSPPSSLRFVAVGGGRVAPALLEEAERRGLPVYEGYGLTECTSVVTLNTPAARRRGSVGRPLRHARVRIDGAGQVRVSGSSIGCYLGDHSPRSDEFATGDVGHFDEDGYLYLRGRSRNVFINSYGRNISPDWIEPEFLSNGAIAQIAIFGEARPWNIAVIVVCPGVDVVAVDQAIARVNSSLPDYARVGDWIAADEPFTSGNGLLTGNGRVRRAAVHAIYQQRIEASYDAADAQRSAG